MTEKSTSDILCYPGCVGTLINFMNTVFIRLEYKTMKIKGEKLYKESCIINKVITVYFIYKEFSCLMFDA